MAKTARDICDRALRDLGVVASGSDMTAEEFADAETALNALYAELTEREGFDLGFTLANTPEWAFVPLAQALAAEMAPQFTLPPPTYRGVWGIPRLRRHVFPDDRTPVADGGRFF